jgi:uncharacterized protein (DUF1501 family)
MSHSTEHFSKASRRAFLRKTAGIGALASATPWGLQLAALGQAATANAASTVSDYKALVCVFMYGGNDHNSTFIPTDATSAAAYRSIRGSIAVDPAQALTLSNVSGLPSGRSYGLAPGLAAWQSLYNSGKLGVLLNTGPLVVPTTQAQFSNRAVPLPPKLFSHNDQQSVWQSLQPEGATSGWGGRMGDMLLANNAQSTFTCVNVSGNAVYMAGNQAVQYQVSSGGAVALNASRSPIYGSQAVADAMLELVRANRSHWIEAEHTKVMARSVEAQRSLGTALAGQAALSTAFPSGSGLASQLQMVARMIAARQALGAKRQVFFVSLGGFDHHDNLTDLHPGLIAQVSDAMGAFYNATVELGVANAVTSFTASDFGRTLSSNGDGSDHGWGSHHVVMGGAVQGGKFWGQAPEISLQSTDQVGQGRLLPTTSVDQLGVALAKWFGVSDSDVPLVFASARNFDLNRLSLFA